MNSKDNPTESATLLQNLVSFNKKQNNNAVVFYQFLSKKLYVISLNYEELEKDSSFIKKMLQDQCTDEKAQKVIGINVDYSERIVSLLLGVLSAGHCFIWLSKNENQAFLSDLVQKASVQYIVTDVPDIWSMDDTRDLVLGQNKFTFGKLSTSSQSALNVINAPLLAYIMQTSGTTGNPKIVRVPHSCICPNIINLRNRWSVSTADFMFLASPLTFDPSIIEIFVSLYSGSTLVIICEEIKANPSLLADILLNRSPITILQLTPTLFKSFDIEVHRRFLSASSPLKSLVFGGENFSDLSNLWRLKEDSNKTKIFNIYGITEVSCWVSCAEIHRASSIDGMLDIGQLLSDTEWYIGNSDVARLTWIDGTEGELYLGGQNRRCLINSEIWKTAPTFRATGDLVRIISNKLYLIGRLDDQIKRHGKRINLAQIEQVLFQFPSVANCSAVYDHNCKRILCAVTLNTDYESKQSDQKQQLIKLMSESLPSYMHPDKVRIFRSLPFTTHGKLDKRLIIEWFQEKTNNPGPDKSLSQILFDIVKNMTGVDPDLQSIFLRFGFDSIKAVHFVNLLERSLDKELPGAVQLILEGKSLGDLMKYVQNDCDLEPVPKRQRSLSLSKDTIRKKSKTAYSCSINLLWKWNSGKCIDASPRLVTLNNNVQMSLVGSHSGHFVSITPSNGRVFWERQLPDRVEATCTVTSDNKFVVVGCFDGSVNFLHIVDGTIHWRVETGDAVKCTGYALHLKSRVLIGSHDYFLYYLDYESKEIIWRRTVDGAILSTPSTDSTEVRVFVATLASDVFCFSLDSGDILWKISLAKPVFGSLSSISDFALVVPCVDGSLCFLDETDGSQLTKYTCNGALFSGVSVSDDKCIVFGSQDGLLHCLKFNQQFRQLQTLWTKQLKSAIVRTPMIYKRFQCSMCCVSTKDGSCYIVCLDSGSILTEFVLEGQCFSTPALSNDDVLMIGCRDNNLYGFKLHNYIA